MCDGDDDDDGHHAVEDPGGLHDRIRESPSRPALTGSVDDDDGGCGSSSCPPRFGDGNEEPGGHLQCCCPGVRISYCKLSQVVLATLIGALIIATVASALF
ncbi:unnamed protein product [Laminaria digitata]